MKQNNAILYRLGLAVLVIASGIIFARNIYPTLGDLSGDSAAYILLARSLAQGRGFSDIEKPGAPAHTEYGPGLPVCLMPIAARDDADFPDMKRIIWAFALLAVPLVFILFRKENGFLALAVSAAASLIPLNVHSVNLIMADIPYLTMSVLALALIGIAQEREDLRWWIVAGIASAAAFFFRQVGIALFPAGLLAVIFQGWKKDKKKTAVHGIGLALGFMPAVAAWLIRNTLVSGSPDESHLSKLFAAQASNPLAGEIGITGLLERMLHGLWFYALEVGRQMSGGFLDHRGLTFIASLLALLICLGLVLKLRTRCGALEFYLPLYLIFISVWQVHYARYLLPVVPLLYYYLFGAAAIISRLIGNTNTRRVILASLAVVIIGINLLGLWSASTRMKDAPVSPADRIADQESMALIHEVNWAGFVQVNDWLKNPEIARAQADSFYHFLAIAEWMKRNLPRDSVTACRKPRLLALYSRTLVVQFPPQPQPAALIAGLQQKGVEYVLFDEISPEVRRILERAASTYPDRFQQIKSLGHTKLMKIVK